MSDFKYPTSTFLKRESKKKESKAEQAIKDFGSLMSDKTHPDNQTEAYHNNVKSILNSLLVGADELENKNPGEGIYSMLILSLRSNLKLKDKIVELEVKMRELKSQMKRNK